MVWRDAGFDIFWGRYSGCKLKVGAGSGNFSYERERDFEVLGGRMRESRGGSGGKRDYNFLRNGLYKFRRDRHCHVKKGGMAGLPEKKDGIAGFENPIVDPLFESQLESV